MRTFSYCVGLRMLEGRNNDSDIVFIKMDFHYALKIGTSIDNTIRNATKLAYDVFIKKLLPDF
jgi:hypothetical protein